ncbi:DNA methyltransferase [Cyanobacterium sp. DS4]|uniref:DNA methyltransferase n=1 Tax=Cyanobacterium sp. DS4 TaxID=2878255 RepID=UPI002E81CC84|nr:DNA methyltransferase [Cyanobacterium sp. Dongsha4]WVL01099.1 restriction endonuclease [Cyanobacterium sp. Dongsha4]
MIKKLYYGDNLDILRNHIDDGIIDLIYLDPPFNSQVNYNVIFNSPKGEKSQAQITAFEDTWTWTIESERYIEELKNIRGELAELLDLLVRTLGKNSLSAYLVMMAIRLVELHRVLKQTGSLYLHCDPTASHYLKMILDIIFGANNFRNEISWKRSQPKSQTKNNFSNCRDVILRYTKTNNFIFNKLYGEHNQEYVDKFYRYIDENGRRYRLGDLTNPNPDRPNLTYEFLGVTRVWRWTKERMQKAYQDGLIVQSKKGAVPRLKRYLDEMKGQPITDNWDDIEHLHGSHKERLGYPTQKPLKLLERIIEASSNENDLILDPFCGCGTAVHAAEKLNRQWIGIDVTHLAISLIEKRLRDAFKDKYLDNSEELIRKKQDFFEVEGTPKTLDAAQDLFNRDPYQFQWWAISLVNAQPYQGKKKKGADSGIDGIIYFTDFDSIKSESIIKKIVVSVKGGKNVNVAMIRDLRGTMEANKASLGFFITLTPPTKPMEQEAAKAGFYQAGNGKKYPLIQLFTIEGLINGTQKPEYYDLSWGKNTFKQAEKETLSTAKQMKIDI